MPRRAGSATAPTFETFQVRQPPTASPAAAPHPDARSASDRRRRRPTPSSSTSGGREPRPRARGALPSCPRLRCESPRRLWTKIITVGTPARDTSAASCSGPKGRRCGAGDVEDRLFAEGDERLVEEDRLDRPDALRARRRCSPPPRSALAASTWESIDASFAASRWRWSRSCSAFSTTEVTMPGLQRRRPTCRRRRRRFAPRSSAAPARASRPRRARLVSGPSESSPRAQPGPAR